MTPRMPIRRNVLLHYHLFKNAGTSIDHILQQNFGDRWQTREFETDKGGNTAQVAQWICDQSQAVAFSSHTISGPLPDAPGINVMPLVMLRDPVARIASAYHFERAQNAQTRGAELAKQHALAGYVHARLSTKGDRQCRNFQTTRLASLLPDMAGSELDRACGAANLIARRGVLGLVEDFGGAMNRLAARLSAYHPKFSWQPVTKNASARPSDASVSPEMREILLRANEDDTALLQHARNLLRQATTSDCVPQAAGMV